MRSDRHAIRKELGRTEKAIKGDSDDEKILNRLHKLEKRLNASIKKKSWRKANVPAVTYPEALPITRKKDEIVEAIRCHQVVVITGETGSGKTTQIPKMCLEAGRGIDGMIGCTQPRRVAAVTVAHRIAEEMGEAIAKSVGYKIRFEDKTGRNPYIKIMTDGILLVETQSDPYLNKYDTLILDEAHERSLNIDFALGIIKTLLKKRRDLKLIITSATIDTEKFSRAFDNAPIIEVSGRMYPVDVRYLPIDPELEEKGEVTYVDAAARAVGELAKDRRHAGDILIFMPTERDIRETCDLLEARKHGETAILPLFARLSWAEQRRVFLSTPGRKIVVATNVAETSITIPGIRYVIDTGLARISRYSSRSGTKSLPVTAISRSSADQRKGRCGRVQDGVCIRLYPEEDYEDRSLFTLPEILRSNLAEVILRMLALNIGDISSFPFIDRPDPRNIKDGFDTLRELGAISSVDGDRKKEAKGGQRFVFTEKGRVMARIPMDPRISRMLIEAGREGCVEEVTVIASALSIQDPRERPIEKEPQADQMHARFKDPVSDFITLLNIWNRYHDTWDALRTQNRMRKFCREHFLSYNRMREWRDIHDEITTILGEETENGVFRKKSEAASDIDSLYARIHKSILSGYLSNIAVKKERNIYTATRGREVMIFPGSGLFGRGGAWIVAEEMVETSRLFARVVANIESDWLEELGGELCRSTYSEPHWERNRGEVVAFEQVSLYGLIIVPKRSVSYGRIDPDEASGIFIRSALVDGDMKESLTFLAYNKELIEEITGMEDKIRRRDLLVSEDILVQFYEKRLGGICDVRTLKKFIRDRGGDDFLRMSEEDILRSAPDDSEISLYPDELVLGGRKFRCSYRLNPGKPDDGVTLKIPASLIPAVPPESTDWLVPGLFREKITMLVKGLPKEFRRKLVPVAKTVDVIMSEMKSGESSLISALGKFIYERFGVNIPASAWSPDALPNHLKMRLSVVDSEDRELCSSRDVDLLQRDVPHEVELPGFDRVRAAWEKTGLTRWDFGDIPESIALENMNGFDASAWPGLVEGDGCVNLRLFKSKQDAERSHIKGVMTLYAIHFRKDLKFLKRQLSLQGDMKKWANYFGGAKYLEDAMYERVIRSLFRCDVRTQEAFLSHAKSTGSKILIKGQEVLNEIEPVLEAYHDTRTILYNLETVNRSSRVATGFLAGLRKDLDRLMPKEFPELYESERLKHVIRYLGALAIRAERGLLNLEKDRSRAGEIEVFSDKLEGFLNNLPDYTSDEKRRAIDEYRWMIEEYKVSLFAQELKTPYPISRKRLEKKMMEVERMG